MIKVNGRTLPEDHLYREMQYHPAESKDEALFQAARTLVIGEVLKDRAEALGLELDDWDDPAGEADFIEQLFDAEVTYPKATTEECRQYFEANPERFTTSPLLDVSHILLAADPEDDDERMQTLEHAEVLLERLKSDPKRFAELAKRHSACTSQNEGGSLGQLERGQTVPEFERPVFSASVGLLPNPVESRYGYHLVQIHHRVEGQALTFDMVESDIRDYLNEKVRRKAIAQYLTQLLADANIEGLDMDVSASPLMQ